MQLEPDPEDAAWAFLQTASDFTDQESLQDAFAHAVGAFGFDRFSCTLIALRCEPPLPKVLFGRSPTQGDEHDLARSRFLVDAAEIEWDGPAGPFAWHDLTPERLYDAGAAILGKADYPAGFGRFLAPIVGGYGEFLAVQLSGPPSPLDPGFRPTVHAIAMIYAYEGVKLRELAEDSRTRTPLSLRETECLRWVAAGRPDCEISELMGISEAAIDTLMDAAKRKIGARSRAQAAVLATAKGWLAKTS